MQVSFKFPRVEKCHTPCLIFTGGKISNVQAQVWKVNWELKQLRLDTFSCEGNKLNCQKKRSLGRIQFLI